MSAYCPNCLHDIAPKQINQPDNLAKCSHCHHLIPASALLTDFPEKAHLFENGRASLIEQADGSLIFSLSPKGINIHTIFLGGFALFWLSFISLWTGWVFILSPDAWLLSLPLWPIALALIYTFFNAISAGQQLLIKSDQIILIKDRLLFPKRYTYGRKQFFFEGHIVPVHNKGFEFQLATDRIPFFEYVNDKEKNWLAEKWQQYALIA